MVEGEKRLGWLSARGYNLVLESVSRLLRPYQVATREERRLFSEAARDILLEEWFRVERRLNRYDFFPDMEVGKIPDIDKVVNLSPFDGRREMACVEVLGMIGAGKDALIERLDELGDPMICCTREPYGEIESRGKFPKRKLDRQQMILAGTIAEMVGARLVLKRRGMERGGVAVLNRSFVDYPYFDLARLLAGDISLYDYCYSPERWVYRATSPDQDAVVIFMADPETALGRKEDSCLPDRKYTNLRFLGILYEVCLVAIGDLREGGQRNLVVLGMRGGVEENFEKFRRVLELMMGRGLGVAS